MAIKKYKPTTPGRRGMTVTDYSVLSKVEPERSLLEPMKKSAGRNNLGRITVRHHGGGNRTKYRVIDFKRDKVDMPAVVKTLEYDPNRSAHIALVQYEDGEKRYIIAPEGLKVGDTVMSGAGVRQYPRRHHYPQHRAVPRQGRAAGAQRRQHGAADGERGQIRSGAPAVRRNAQRSRELHRHDRPGRQHRP